MAINYQVARWDKNKCYETKPKTKSFSAATKQFETLLKKPNTYRVIIKRHEGGISETIVSKVIN